MSPPRKVGTACGKSLSKNEQTATESAPCRSLKAKNTETLSLERITSSITWKWVQSPPQPTMPAIISTGSFRQQRLQPQVTSKSAPQSMEAFFVGNNLSVTESTAEKNSTEKQMKSIAFPLEPIAFTTLFENGMNCVSMLIGFLSSSEASVLTSREKSPSSSEAIITEKKITAPLVLEPSSIAPTAPTANDGEGLTAKSKRC